MSSGSLERRLVVEEHRARAAKLSKAIDETVAEDGTPLREVDPRGVLAESVKSLSRLANTLGHFDVTVQLGPENLWAIHMVGVDGELTLRLVQAPPPAPDEPEPEPDNEPEAVDEAHDDAASSLIPPQGGSLLESLLKRRGGWEPSRAADADTGGPVATPVSRRVRGADGSRTR